MEGSFGREPVKCGGNLEASSTHRVLVKKKVVNINTLLLFIVIVIIRSIY